MNRASYLLASCNQHAGSDYSTSWRNRKTETYKLTGRMQKPKNSRVRLPMNLLRNVEVPAVLPARLVPLEDGHREG